MSKGSSRNNKENFSNLTQQKSFKDLTVNSNHPQNSHSKKVSQDKLKFQGKHMETFNKLMQLMVEKNQLNQNKSRVKSSDKTTLRPQQQNPTKKTSLIENKNIKNSGSKSREKSIANVYPSYILKQKQSRNGIGARMNTQLGQANTSQQYMSFYSNMNQAQA